MPRRHILEMVLRGSNDDSCLGRGTPWEKGRINSEERRNGHDGRTD